MTNEEPNNAVLHVIVVGFHHQRGSEVELSFPPLAKEGSIHYPTLPSEWRFLPFLALPDGAHNWEQDVAFFLLPSLGFSNTNGDLHSTIYGISCYRQIDSKELKAKTEDVTRSTVQKSVCILSCLPLFGYIREKLEVATRLYFEEKDFSRTQILEELYKHLNAALSPKLLEESLVCIGLPLTELVTKFRQRVLVLFKLLLLERKVIFYGFPVSTLCTQLLALLSLIPKMLQSGLTYAAPRDDHYRHSSNSENETISSPSSVNRPLLPVDSFGFPLAVFTENSVFCPYLSLQQINVVKSAHVRSFVVGASNILFKRQKGISDVLVDLETGSVEIHDLALGEQLTLSTADLRFTDYLIQRVNFHVEKGDLEAGWDGSEEWVRAQFKVYLLSLFSTIQHTDGEAMGNFNSQFVEAWRETTNFRVWREKEHAGIDDVHAGHPFQGQMGLSDIKIRLSNVVQDVAAKGLQTAGGRRIGQAVTDTGKAVGGAINSARSYVTSWLSELAQSGSDQNENDAEIVEDVDSESAIPSPPE